jgi:hypothetical protein
MSLNLADPFSFFLFLVWIARFYTGSAKSYGSCPLDKMLSNGYLANSDISSYFSGSSIYLFDLQIIDDSIILLSLCWSWEFMFP